MRGPATAFGYFDGFAGQDDDGGGHARRFEGGGCFADASGGFASSKGMVWRRPGPRAPA